jgi:hypothetical protein
MSRKMNRKQKHKKRQKPIGIEGNRLTDTSPTHTQQNHCEEIQNKNNEEEEPAQLSKQWEWDLMTVLTAILAAGTIVTFVVLLVQLQDARENFQTDQRPYIWPSMIEDKSIPIQAYHPLQADIRLANYGKSPALHVVIAKQIFYGAESKHLAYAWFNDPRLKNLNAEALKQDKGVNVIPPWMPPQGEKGPAYATAITTSLTDAEVDYVTSHDYSYFIVGRVEYTNLSGTKTYRSDFCSFHYRTGALGQCGEHNEMQ